MVTKNKLHGRVLMRKSVDRWEAAGPCAATFFSQHPKALSMLPSCLLEISKQAQLPDMDSGQVFLDCSDLLLADFTSLYSSLSIVTPTPFFFFFFA